MEWYSKRKLARLEKEKLAREKEIEEVTQKVIEKAIPPILNELKEKNGQQDARLDQLTKTSSWQSLHIQYQLRPLRNYLLQYLLRI